MVPADFDVDFSTQSANKYSIKWPKTKPKNGAMTNLSSKMCMLLYHIIFIHSWKYISLLHRLQSYRNQTTFSLVMPQCWSLHNQIMTASAAQLFSIGVLSVMVQYKNSSMWRKPLIPLCPLFYFSYRYLGLVNQTYVLPEILQFLKH